MSFWKITRIYILHIWIVHLHIWAHCAWRIHSTWRLHHSHRTHWLLHPHIHVWCWPLIVSWGIAILVNIIGLIIIVRSRSVLISHLRLLLRYLLLVVETLTTLLSTAHSKSSLTLARSTKLASIEIRLHIISALLTLCSCSAEPHTLIAHRGTRIWPLSGPVAPWHGRLTFGVSSGVKVVRAQTVT